MKDAAIVSLAIGEEHLAYWRNYCEAGWKVYAQKFGYDVIMVTEPMDRSAPALARSPAWQKCLILSQEFSLQYRQIIWLDCDIAINADAAPRITDQVPVERLGGVISGSHIHDDLRAVLLARLRGTFVPYERGSRQWQEDQAAYYAGTGHLSRFGAIVQTGVLVASPQHHRTLFEGVYAAPYAENRNYEQIPLSHAALRAGVFHPIDTRFNSVFYETLLVHYPYLLTPQLPLYDVAAACAVQTQFANNFFLHFAYNRDFARHLAPPAPTG